MADVQTMELSLQSLAIVYGPLAIGWLVSSYAAIRLYRDNQALRLQCDAEKKAANDEIVKLQDRYIAKSDTYTEKLAEMATSSLNVVRAATKTVASGGGNPSGL